MAPAKANIATGILYYLSQRPDAQDTLEGITEWWLRERPGTGKHIATVKAALVALVAQGLVIEVKGRASHRHYKINRRKLKDISALSKAKD